MGINSCDSVGLYSQEALQQLLKTRAQEQIDRVHDRGEPPRTDLTLDSSDRYTPSGDANSGITHDYLGVLKKARTEALTTMVSVSQPLHPTPPNSTQSATNSRTPQAQITRYIQNQTSTIDLYV